MAPFYQWSSNVWKIQSHYEETVYLLPRSPQEYLVLISATLKEWKAESTLKPPSDFEPGTHRLVIQHFNH